ncbi:MAG: hypothetical protein O7C75_00255 [Verrucomicrobia bacterium]|nr:hypothetical protein [Verrucomicrobiota bacterium]
MIQTVKTQDGKLAIIARMGIKYIPFELDDIAQDWARQQSKKENLTAVDLVTMVLSGRAKAANPSAHTRVLKRIEEEQQLPLELDFTQSFLCCEDTGQENNLCLCLIHQGKDYDLKLLTDSASNKHPVEKQIPITELSLNLFKEIMETGNFSQAHPTVKRLKHWFAGRMELWGLAYG